GQQRLDALRLRRHARIAARAGEVQQLRDAVDVGRVDDVGGGQQIIEHQLRGPRAIPFDAAGLSRREKDVLRPRFAEKILNLAGNGQVRLVGRLADQITETGCAQAFAQRYSEERRATSNVNAGAAFHAASGVRSAGTNSLNATSVWCSRARSASR